jgi:formyl-CoA transferase/CoA:oxalate CoA-transferase
LQKWDVPGGPVNNIAEALADPQVLLRNMVVEVDHPTAGKYKTAGNPIKTGAAERFDPPPTLGMDTSGILTELLGYSEGEVGAMRQTGAV